MEASQTVALAAATGTLAETAVAKLAAAQMAALKVVAKTVAAVVVPQNQVRLRWAIQVACR